LPTSRKINCPACGFSISADSKSCDFCGFEFETSIDEKPSTASFKSELADKQDERLDTQTQKKTANGKKNGSRAKPATPKPGVEGLTPAETGGEVLRTGFQPELGKDIRYGTVSPEDRIKELEKQLSEAEKELDVISKILVETPQQKKQESAQAGTNFAQPATVIEKTPKIETPRLDNSGRRAVQATPAIIESVNPAKEKKASLHLRIKALTAVSIVVGAAVYAVSAILSASIGGLEEYFLMFAGAVLITLGLYTSIETTEIDRTAYYHS
jgi:hypothetical protein